ncbi:MAG: ABC transporter permease [Chloroflexi bacterium]|nr:ABC transporter permease [Chloroflexota bacterium]
MRDWLDTVSGAWNGLITHRLRSSLTVLGVVIGVAAVIALMAVGQGAQNMIISNVQGLGSNLLFIRPGGFTQAGVRSGAGTAQSLTLEDAYAIAGEVPNVVGVAPYVSSFMQIVAGGQNTRSQVIGITPDYQTVLDLGTQQGDYISYEHFQAASKVAVIGPNIGVTLFGDSDPLGQNMRIGSITVRIIGVLEGKGESAMGSTDDAILIPLTAMQQTMAQSRTNRGDRIVSSITVGVTDPAYVSQVTEEVASLLRYRHQVAVGQDDDFIITSQQQLIDTISSSIGTMTLLLAAIAAISLLVGGIGVMNIMLVSVVERTREIGIRKALGARERDIWTQFLVEAAFLTLAGGVLGILLGWGGATLVARSGIIETAISLRIVVLAVSVSIGIGLFFGFYPAWNASRLDPVQALRAE